MQDKMMAGAKAAMAFVFKTLSRQDARAQTLVDYVDEIYAALIFVLERSKRVLTTLSIVHHTFIYHIWPRTLNIGTIWIATMRFSPNRSTG
jgi:hypothetical protein